MEKCVLFYPEGHSDHYLFGHPERPERIDAIRDGLIEIDLWESLPKINPLEINTALLGTVHSPDYIDLLEQTSSRGSMLDPDTYTTVHSWQLALNAAGGAAAVAETVWDGQYRTGFALSRPPGHHATQNRGMGFCLINNIAVAVENLIQNKGAKKLVVVDLDLHHGNGTQDIFWQRSDVGFCSIHQAPFYPGTGMLNEVGSGKGEGYTMNLPIPTYSGDQAYLTLVRELIIPFLERTGPEMLLISFGFDTHWRDPLGSMQVSALGIHHMIKDLMDWTDKNCHGRLAVILEGGYDLEAGNVSGQAISTALMKQTWQDTVGSSPVPEKDHWLETYHSARQLWGI